MVKLSKTGWNNVIIFAVMGFILLINVTNNKIFLSDKNSDQNIALVGQQNVILTLSMLSKLSALA